MGDGKITEADVSQLIDDVSDYRNYAFLIGAGTSRSAGIPTTNELIDEWKNSKYNDKNRDLDFDNWVGNEEENMEDGQSEYGFWFERKYPKRIHRRNYIQSLVDDSNPTHWHILLALMMDKEYIPHVLTPNFDDLLFDAFYRYLGYRPTVIDHRSIAPEFRLVSNDPTIVKLHGDYLYDNLKNTDSETDALEPAMEEVLQRTVSEYGLVVVGYGGGDESIMEPLKNSTLSEYGIYWCVLDKDSINEELEELLVRPNVHMVEIDGFGSLMARFEEDLPGIELPAPDEVVERAEQRAEGWARELRKMVSQTDEAVATDEEEEVVDRTEKRWRAIELLNDEKYSSAISLLDDVIESNPGDARAFYHRGKAKFDQERYYDAIDDFNQAIDLDPEFSIAYKSRGYAKDEVGEYKEAIEDYDKALELDPDDKTTLSNRGVSKSNYGNVQDAIEDFNKALEIDSESELTYNNRGNARITQGNYDEAINDFNRALEIDENYAMAYGNRARAKGKKDQLEAAIKDYDKAIELEPDNPTFYNNRGHIKMKLRKYEEAKDDFDRHIELKPDNALGYNNRAEVNLLLGNYKESKGDSLMADRFSDSKERNAITLMLLITAKLLLDEEIEQLDEEHVDICGPTLDTSWETDDIKVWLEDADLGTEKKTKIREVLERID